MHPEGTAPCNHRRSNGTRHSTVLLLMCLAGILGRGRCLCALHGTLLLRRVATLLVGKTSTSLVSGSSLVMQPVGAG